MRARLFIASLAIVSAVIVLAGLFAHLELRRWLEARVEDELTHKLAVARVAVEMSASAPDDALADRLGDALDARVTIIDESGAVRGDSDVAAADLTALENHRARPEVAVALAAGHGDARGRDRRMSATVHKDMLYLAQKFTRADSAGVIRVATDYDVVDAAAARLRMLLALAGALGLAAAVGMSAFASTMLSRTLRTLVAHAQSLATEGSARFDVDGGDEITGVAGTLQRLADDLARTVLTLASERDRFAAVLEAMSEGVIGLDASGAVVLINAAARDLLQVGEGALDLARIAGLDDAATKARGGAVASAEIEVPVKRTVQVRAAPVRAGGAVLVLHDISEVRRLERVRRDFVGNVSHELRTPVSVIRASAETLLHSGVDDA
ncbi:MAG TPA: histidine kinase dimerization/phospho-acceptor domain-containing protein, partial [Myxococcota bacterium]